MQGSWKEQLKQKFRNGCRVDPADAKEDKENSQSNGQDDASEPPAKKKTKGEIV